MGDMDGVVGFRGGVAGRQGLEPRYADPESAVLPLDDLPAGFARTSIQWLRGPSMNVRFSAPGAEM